MEQTTYLWLGHVSDEANEQELRRDYLERGWRVIQAVRVSSSLTEDSGSWWDTTLFILEREKQACSPSSST